MKLYYKDLKIFAQKKTYVISLFLVALLSYGFAINNGSINIDNLEGERYVNENVMLAAGRFSITFFSVITGSWTTAFVTDLLSVVFMSLTATNICILFRRVTKDQFGMASCAMFSCIFISYPLINEIWSYSAYSPSTCLLLMSWALLLVQELIHRKNRGRYGRLMVAAGLMLLVCAGYESVVPVYIFFVFAVLALQIVYGEEKEKKLSQILLQGMVYVGVLIIGLLLRVVLHKVILTIMDLEAVSNGATEIYWGKYPAADLIKQIVRNVFHNYILKALIYFPITEIVVAGLVLLVIGFFACKKYGAVLLLPGFGMFLSLVILSVVQGTVSPYRTCQVFGAFVAFVAMLIANWAQQRPWKRWKWLKHVVMVLLAYLCFQQAVYLNFLLTQNYLRSEEEAFTIRQIGVELKENYDQEKPVIFVGRYSINERIQEAVSVPENSLQWQLYLLLYEQLHAVVGQPYDLQDLTRKLPQTNVSSVIEWGHYSYGQEAMQNLFSYYGFDYVLADYNSVYEEACKYATENQLPYYPQKGYIADVGDYIIVCVGALEE